MRFRVKILFMFFYLFLIFMTEVCSQNEADSINNTTTYYLFTGLGYKYHFTKVDTYSYDTYEVYKNRYAFSLGIAADFWGGQKHFIGLEIIGFPYVYGDHLMSPQYFSLITSLFYRRNIHILNNIVFFPAAGLTFFSNDPAHMLTMYVDMGISYDLGNYELFIKNSFRISPRMIPNTPWYFIIGCSIKL